MLKLILHLYIVLKTFVRSLYNPPFVMHNPKDDHKSGRNM